MGSCGRCSTSAFNSWFLYSSYGNKPARLPASIRRRVGFIGEVEAVLVEACMLNIKASRRPQRDLMGSGCWVCQRGSMGRMLHIGCECWDGASVSLTQLSNASVQCSPCFQPSRPPPHPLSSSNKWSFCSSVFAAVGWRASAGPSPKTSGLSWNSSLLQSIICGLSVLLLSLPYCPLYHCLCFSTRHNLCPHTTSSLTDFWHSFPPFCSLHSIFLHQNLSCLHAFASSFPFLIVSHSNPLNTRSGT